ncbi:o-succinylbenzoate synthase [Boudabousia marimammalium]|uniref:o-succinylbenzoate synthase n=1 Tax=Boudabousia marimammalium TaxID=156892 RepID=A0A1Q5PMD6_9ACTO|nr:o-succinylbenzoate synthase [Boudabousia marimammalium]OKL48711.1 O-succinylbenzoate synthase [Boudabousia marimammalium]
MSGKLIMREFTAAQIPTVLQEAGIDRVVAWSTPMRMRFRRITEREGLLLHGRAGWGEVSPFWDYGPKESATWLRAGIELATATLPAPLRTEIPVNVTVPVCAPQVAYERVKNSGCHTAKVKVADPNSGLAADCARLEAVRDALGPGGKIRVDANQAWDEDAAVSAIAQLDAVAGGLEYVEQPCETVEELAAVRRRVQVPIAADESVRRASDPLRVARAEAADVMIVKMQPLGGVRAAAQICEQLGLPAVVSSALDSGVGIWGGAALAATLPDLPYACGLATGDLLAGNPAMKVTHRPGFVSLERPGLDEATLLDSQGNGNAEVSGQLLSRWEERLRLMTQQMG